MNHGKLLLFALGLPVLLLLTGCQSKAPTIVPVTGPQQAAPALAVLARDSVLEYVLSSSRLTSLPKDADWQLDVSKGSEKDFCFRNDDWLMMIRLADADDGNQFVIIINKVSHASWIGYVTPNGHVVDTTYGR
jgi:hypothetical protein